MKKMFLVSMLLCPLFLAAGLTGLGVRAGAAVTNLTGDVENEKDTKTLTALSAGVFYNYSLIPLVSLRPEIGFIKKGIKKEGLEMSSSYVEMTLPVEISIPLGIIDIPVFAGGFAGYQISEKEREEANKLQYGVTGGVGVELNLAAVEPGLEFRYERALSALSDEQDSAFFHSFIFSGFVKF